MENWLRYLLCRMWASPGIDGEEFNVMSVQSLAEEPWRRKMATAQYVICVFFLKDF